MKGLLVGIVGAIALKAPPSAADLAARPCAKAPPPATAAVYDWNGFYIGINGGSGSSHKCWDFVRAPTSALVNEEREGRLGRW
jgi:outer membrane immunogenic protein